ncbi:AraC family transcriptional regulator [Homoserinibacter sp. YIM 151385]|uniref:AraC family transcriptional regulator n=1 Tax=Homoserinibacter sp. YIM 151385 TaxID=2985506 RepID=UPI0022F07206|nr:AraC family transcriptional regulator [Homoserinibacter sp. YIM 151385]WBU37586.1 AraC family transcriptional regulator [Homoserinibacter sp. YIM 151385]
MGDATEEHDPGTPWRLWIPPVAVPEQREHDVHVLLWQVRGTASLLVDGEERELATGHAVWIPVDTTHEFTVHADSVTMPLFFDAAATATTLGGPTVVTVDRDLRTLLLAYAVALNTIVKPGVNLARQILALLEERPVLATSLPMPSTESALGIAETLRFNPGDIRSIEELASSVHASPRTIERAFRAETGMTLRQWRIRNRMEAAALLLRSDTRLDAVAHRVGYTNVNAFRRVFLGHFGATPSEYRARFARQ